MFQPPPLPPNLPVPVDDGACDHLLGHRLPDLALEASSGRRVELAQLTGLTVIYIFPMSSADSSSLPDNWDAIPGARGCTPQSCSFRDHRDELAEQGAEIFGLAALPTDYLRSEAERMHLPFELLSDQKLELRDALDLPVLPVTVGGQTLLSRVTLICDHAEIIHVDYPVFPPDKSGAATLDWLRARRG